MESPAESPAPDLPSAPTLPLEPATDDSVKGLGLAIASLVLLCCVLAIYGMLRSRLRSLPDSISSIVVGFAAGVIARLSGHDVEASLREVLPNPDTFFLLCIPFIIFEAGYSLHKGRFMRQVGSILMFAIPGTILTCFSFCVPLWLLGVMRLSRRLSFLDAMSFGALLSAVDPVATLAIFQHVKVNETLYALVLGEAVLNDAVAIALFHLSLDIAGRASDVSPLRPLLDFARSFLGSILVGVATGLASAALFKHSALRRYPALELAVLVLLSYWPFAFCEGVAMSGILAILFNAAVMAHFTHKNLSAVSQVVTGQLFRVAAFISETFVFTYLGLTLATMRLAPSPSLIVWGVLLCVASRAANVFPCSWLLNRYREEKIAAKDQFIMFFSGLRGAIAYALSLNLRSPDRAEIQTAALFIVLFTVVFLGGGTLPMLKALDGEWGQVVVSRISDPPLPFFRLPASVAAGALAASAAADRLMQTPARLLGEVYVRSRPTLERLHERYLAPAFEAAEQPPAEALAELAGFLPPPLAAALLERAPAEAAPPTRASRRASPEGRELEAAEGGGAEGGAAGGEGGWGPIGEIDRDIEWSPLQPAAAAPGGAGRQPPARSPRPPSPRQPGVQRSQAGGGLQAMGRGPGE